MEQIGANCNISELNGVISPAYSNLRAKPNTEIVPKYYDYYFKTQYWLMAMFVHGKGVSFDNRWTINNDTLRSYEIPVVPYSIQKDIAGKILTDTNIQSYVPKMVKPVMVQYQRAFADIF